MTETVRVFIGCGVGTWLPYKVLEYSILRRASGPVEVTPLCEVEERIPIPQRWRDKLPTEFSLQRFLIPEACGFEGKGIYLDSDMVVLADIRKLWDTPFPKGAKVLTTGGWQSAVMQIDCAATGWRIGELVDRMESGRLKYAALSNLRFLDGGELAGALDPRWNCMDRPNPERMVPDDGAFLLHYTDLAIQPNTCRKHPVEVRREGGQLAEVDCGPWHQELRAALAEGFITPDDITREILAGHVRPSLRCLIGGECEPDEDRDFMARVRAVKFRLDRMKGAA